MSDTSCRNRFREWFVPVGSASSSRGATSNHCARGGEDSGIPRFFSVSSHDLAQLSNDRKQCLPAGSSSAPYRGAEENYAVAAVDRLSKVRRSWLMSRVPSKNTGPELRVRRILHRSGLRFRLHSEKLPGVPDIVLRRWMTVVFVHGCFWHRHPNCRKASRPTSNVAFWREKFRRNVARDAKSSRALRELGWNVVVVWACEVSDDRRFVKRLIRRIRGLQNNGVRVPSGRASK
jgi:DNA mismatch endonuclease (patch repair protein)